ncbi:hypothetical protein ONE63_003144 [Megalurothrips usitatus]|uniref:Uncharacterized protein n=1 Tax=Megalurothrips usitatus TaxID=439358 RepID=A0AAV7XA34_9NEOP|nr:hypothetical protein ONE63_003144 [Megalurothrips usitatus]
MIAIVKELYTETRKKLTTSEIKVLSRRGKKYSYEEFNPSSVTDFKRRTAIYGRIKTESDGRQYMYKLWIMMLAESEKNLPSTLPRLPKSSQSPTDREPLSLYVSSMEKEIISKNKTSTKSNKVKALATMGSEIVAQFLKGEDNAKVPGDKGNPSNVIREDEEGDNNGIIPELEGNPDNGTKDQEGDGNAIVPGDKGNPSNVIREDEEGDNNGIIPELEGNPDNIIKDQNISLASLHTEMQNLKQWMELKFQELRTLLLNQAGPSRGIDFNNAVTLENEDQQEAIPDGKVFLGAGNYLRKSLLERIVESKETIRWKVDQIASHMFSVEELRNFYFKVPPHKSATGQKFPETAALGITNAINEVQSRIVAKETMCKQLKIRERKDLQKEQIDERCQQLAAKAEAESSNVSEKEVRSHLSHIFDNHRAPKRQQKVPNEVPEKRAKVASGSDL